MKKPKKPKSGLGNISLYEYNLRNIGASVIRNKRIIKFRRLGGEKRIKAEVLPYGGFKIRGLKRVLYMDELARYTAKKGYKFVSL